MTVPNVPSFIDALRWLMSSDTNTQDPHSALIINPNRPGRGEPRVVKDLHDSYRKLTLPRTQMRRRLDLAKR